MAAHSKMLAFVAQCDDAEKLKSLIRNARDRGELALADGAFRKLISLVPSEQPGTVEHDFWQTIHAFEYFLTEERGKDDTVEPDAPEVGAGRSHADAFGLGTEQQGNRWL